MEGAGARAGFVAGCVFGIGLTICAIFSFLESREFIMEQIEIQLERFAYPMQEIGSLLKVIMIVGPIVIFLTSAIFGLLFGLLYHYLYLHNPRLRTMYGALAGVLFGIFFGFTTNMPPLSRVKTVVICLVLGSIYSVVLLCLHSGYIEIVQLDLDRLQISMRPST